MAKTKRLYNTILTVVMSILCLLWVYPVVLIFLNSLKVEGAGFGGDTNVITIITEDEEASLELMSKEEAASKILDQILARRTKKED